MQHAIEVAGAPSAEHPGRPLTVGLLLTVVCIALDGLAVTTVMPIAVRDLGGLAIYGWAFSAFMLASVVGITVSGRLTDRRGPADAFAFGVALFALGLLGRRPGAVDGVAGGGARDPGSRGRRTLGGDLRERGALLSCRRQPRMLALISTSWVVPGLVGPGLGGLVADHASWRLVFVGLTPVVLVCAILTMPALRRLGRADRGSEDAGGVPFGFAFLVAAGGALVLPRSRPEPPSARGPARRRPGGPAAGRATPHAGGHAARRAGSSRGDRGDGAGQPRVLRGGDTAAALPDGVPRAVGHRGGPRAQRGDAHLDRGRVGAGAGGEARLPQRARRRRRGPHRVRDRRRRHGVHGDAPVLLATAGWAVVGLGMGLAHSTISLTVIEQAPAGAEGAASAAMQLANVLGVALGAGSAAPRSRWSSAAPWRRDGIRRGVRHHAVGALATPALARRLPTGPGPPAQPPPRDRPLAWALTGLQKEFAQERHSEC